MRTGKGISGGQPPRPFCSDRASVEAEIAAKLYRQISRPRGREMDLAIAACAIAFEIPLWTLNRKDFADIPGLKLAHVH